MSIRQLPRESHAWMTDHIRELLRAIRGPHVAKKRATVIKLAFARANQQPVKKVFQLKSTCAETVWYSRWKFKPEIAAAFKACCERALEWADQETAAIEEYYRRLRRQSIAEYAAEAPAALAGVMKSDEQKGADRISAANALITWADPAEAQKAQPHAPPAHGGGQSLNILIGLSDDELDQLLVNLETAEGGDSPGEATPPGSATGNDPAPLDDAQPEEPVT